MSKIEQYKCDWCCTVTMDISSILVASSGQPICKSCKTKEEYIYKLFKDACNRIGSVSIEELLSDMLDQVRGMDV